MTGHSSGRAIAAVVIAAGLLVGAAACGGATDGGSTSSSGAAPGTASPANPGADEGLAARDSSAGSSGESAAKAATAAVLPSSDYLARRAQLSLKVKSIARAAAAVRAASAAAGGLVVTESIGSGGGPRPVEGDKLAAETYGEITVSVPAQRLDTFLDDVSRLGTLLSRQSSSEDVKQQYVDTESRLRTMRASVDRVRALMARATTISQIVALESELSRREADLESLESQLAALKDSIARSPVQVSLTTDPATVAPADTGFLAGLKRGWSAFTASLTVLVTGIGALLPFAVVAALVAVPVTLWLRRRRAGRPPTAATPVGASSTAPPA